MACVLLTARSWPPGSPQVLKELYQPLELMLFIAGLCTIADAFVPQLISVPKATVSYVVKSVLSVSFVAGSSNVLFNIKSRFCKENAWQCEMNGNITAQRRWWVAPVRPAALPAAVDASTL